MSCSRTTPELMAPAGDWDCARAAVENGADAVYFGLQEGFNARARANNFSAADLPKLMAFLRTRGVKGCLTLNTLVFNDELEEAERIVRLAVAAGVDAVLVQDIGLLRLVHRLCPELSLHASTQMTLSGAECIREVESLGVRRVVLPRELSIAQIADIRRQTQLELEVFVHGALCISYSGQCLASLALGGRSANRGQCAQPCRLPYEVICDGRTLDTEKKYPLSPHDLAAYERLPELIAAGVSALKIEGRLKPAEYVASATRHYRAAIDRLNINSRRLTASGSITPTASGEPAGDSAAEMEAIFSRGFCHGWLDGVDHRLLLSGTSSAKRGVYLGEVRGVRGERVAVELAAPIRRGDGLVFEGDRSQAAEQGGRVYEVFVGRRSVEGEVAGGLVELAFRYGSLDFSKIRPGQKVWKTDDPRAARRLQKSYASEHPKRRVALDMTIEAAVGRRLRVTAAATGVSCCLETPEPLAEAQKHPLKVGLLRGQFGRLGKTPYQLRHLEAKIEGRPMVPLSVLGKLRHELVQRLEAAAAQPPSRTMIKISALAALRAEATLPSPFERGAGGEGSGVKLCKKKAGSIVNCPHPNPLPKGEGTGNIPLLKGEGTRIVASAVEPLHLHVLCRWLEQIEAALACGATNIVADFRDLEQCGEAVRIVHAAGGKISLATPRICKPGESEDFDLLANCRPDGFLARNLAALAYCRRNGLSAVADFSLNAVNELTFHWLQARGAQRITAAFDLNRRRLLDLTAVVPPEWLEVVVYRHASLFHSEYCLFCGMLSRGKNNRDCGRPCRRRQLRLRDRLGVEHFLLADGRCRNTLFHAEAESDFEIVPELLKQGVRHFRVELLDENNVTEARRAIEKMHLLLNERI